MKINSNDELKSLILPPPVRKLSASLRTDFGAILNDEIQRGVAGTGATSPSSAMQAVSATGRVPAAQSPTTLTVEQVENVLNLLDDYRAKLANPNITLKDVYPSVARLEDKRSQLAPMVDALHDGQLKNILNQTLITVSLEIVRYHSGEYNPS